MRCDVLFSMCIQFFGSSYLLYAQAVLLDDYFKQYSGKQFHNVFRVFEGVSDIRCTRACQSHVLPCRCTGANYNRQTGECGISYDQFQIVTDTDDVHVTLQRVSDVCTDDLYLVSGANGVPDEFLSASSHYVEGPGYHVPKYARLTNMATVSGTTAWAALTDDLEQWIEARFHNPKTVKGIAIQARPDYQRQYVTEFRVSYSSDCINFQDVTMCNGTTMDFAGNTDLTTVVTQALPAPVTALCIRLNPRKWNVWIALRFDIIGC